jgi:hypothetical protein
MKKKKIIILVALLVIILIMIIILWPKYKVDEEEEKRLKKQTNEALTSITNEDISYKEMKKIIGKDITNVHITVGENSYLRNRPSNKVIKEYKLSSYVLKQEQLAKKVEERYLSNLEYKITSTEVNGNEVCENIEIKTYYYALYLIDLINLTNEIAGDNVEDVSENVQTEIKFFKSQVKALEVLDKHLDDYENETNETINQKVCYKNGKIKDADEMLSLAVALQGETYENCDFSNQNNSLMAEQRLEKYLKEV